jgi:Protein of unknown function (DUF616)
VDFICFTDDLGQTTDTWRLRLFDTPIPTDASRSSRLPKTCAHRYLSEYDVSIYIDNSLQLKLPPEVIMEELLPVGVSLAGVAHSFRRSVEEEFNAVISSGRDASWVCEEQRAAYQSDDPNSLSLQPISGGFLIRRHNDPLVIAAMEIWWSQILRYSRRDQLSLWYSLRLAGLVPHLHQFDLRESAYHKWPLDTGRDRETAGTANATHVLSSGRPTEQRYEGLSR